MTKPTDNQERRSTQDALRESEAERHLLVENMRDIVSRHLPDSTILYVSPSCRRLMGFEQEELIGTRAADYVHPDDIGAALAALTDAVERRAGQYRVRHRSRHRNGNYIWVETVGTLLYTPDGELSEIQCAVRNITERKRTEDAVERRIEALTRPSGDGAAPAFGDLFDLEDIQQLQDQFAEATGVASIITDPNGTPITNPSQFCRLCKDIIRGTEKGLANCYESDKVLGSLHPGGPTVQPCMSGGLWDAGAGISVGGHHLANWLIGQVRNEAQDEATMREYAREIGADEREFIEAFHEVPSMPREQFEKVAQVLFTMANQLSSIAWQNLQQARFITERKQAEEALVQEKALSEEYINSLPGLFYVYDEERFVKWNSAWYEATGYTDEDLAGMYGPDFFEGADRELIATRMQQVFTEGFAEAEASLITKDGRRVPYYFTGLLREFDGRPHLVGLGVDITPRRQAEDEREKLQEQLVQAQKMELVGRLAGGVAHDFNNMLGVILGHTELAMEQVDPDDPLFTNLEEIDKAAQRSTDLTRQLLAFARKQTVSPEVLDLNELVPGTLRMMQRLIGEDIELVWSPGPDLWPLRIDPSQIDQILANLCVNARDAITGVGMVTIETKNTTIDEAYCADHASFSPGQYIELTVSDNGCGMPNEVLDHLFEPFFTTKGVGKGTGLGLATTYGIIRQNRGFVKVYSESGSGTTFRIFLPRHRGSQGEKPRVSTEEALQGGDETILLVEDEAANRRLGAQMLEQLGYRVLVAGTPRRAMLLAEEYAGEIDLLLTDVVMPEMNGRELAEQLRERYPELRLLFMSGYTANVIAQHGVLEEGVNFLQKPFSTMTLASGVRAALEPE